MSGFFNFTFRLSSSCPRPVKSPPRTYMGPPPNEARRPCDLRVQWPQCYQLGCPCGDLRGAAAPLTAPPFLFSGSQSAERSPPAPGFRGKYPLVDLTLEDGNRGRVFFLIVFSPTVLLPLPPELLTVWRLLVSFPLWNEKGG